MAFSKFNHCFSTTISNHLMNCQRAFENNEYFSSAIWGAVFLEAFLSELLNNLAITVKGKDDLNGRITLLQRYNKEKNSYQPSIPDEIIKRCDDI